MNCGVEGRFEVADKETRVFEYEKRGHEQGRKSKQHGGMHLLQFSADQLASFDTFEFVIHFHHKQLTVIGFSGSEASLHRDHRPTARL